MRNAISISALNVDQEYRVESSRQLYQLNRELEEIDQEPYLLGRESFGKPEDLGSSLPVIRKYAKLTSQSLGGSGTNTMIALRRMGRKTGIVGEVGDDDLADFLIQGLKNEDVDTYAIVRGKGHSGLCIAISDGADRALRVFPGANDDLNSSKIYMEYLASAGWIHLTSFACSQGYGPLDAQKMVVEKLGEKVRISFDPGELYCRMGFGEMLPIINRSYILSLSEEEMGIWGWDYREGSKILLEYGPSIVVCKRSEKGCYVASEKVKFKVPVKEVVKGKTVGRGDAFNAGFIYGLLNEKTLKECAELANGCAKYRIVTGEYPNSVFLEKIGWL